MCFVCAQSVVRVKKSAQFRTPPFHARRPDKWVTNVRHLTKPSIDLRLRRRKGIFCTIVRKRRFPKGKAVLFLAKCQAKTYENTARVLFDFRPGRMEGCIEGRRWNCASVYCCSSTNFHREIRGKRNSPIVTETASITSSGDQN